MIPFRSTNHTSLQWFQYNLLHHILPTNTRLQKMGLARSNVCDLCSIEIETTCHIFWECKHIRPLWLKLENWLQQKTSLQIHFNKEKILLGFSDINNDPINIIILIFKKTILKANIRDRQLSKNCSLD